VEPMSIPKVKILISQCFSMIMMQWVYFFKSS
jgi:hypothetical protein